MNLVTRGKWKRRLLTPQMLKVMKLTFILLTAAFLHVCAKGISQTVTYSGKNVQLETVFSEIKKQTGFVFFYTTKDIALSKPITITLDNTPVEDALKKVLNDQPLTYIIKNNTVFIKEKPTQSPALQPVDISLSSLLPPPPIDIHGRITDPDGEPLVGATVKVTGSNAVAVTDGDGRFTLKAVDENGSIEITYVGFVTQTIPVNNRANIILALKRSDSKLDEVQVIAYGTTSERLSTGNVTTVKGEDIQKQPVSNPLLALEGRVPGLFVTQNSGLSGSGVTVRIQGQNSITKGNDPFYVIDGVPYISQLLPSITGILGGSGNSVPLPGGNSSPVGNPLSFINPSDIESIEVLKDADATAIYGSRAANGAILITTKKGKAGKTKVDFILQNGWGKVSRMMNLLSTAEYLQMRQEAKKNDNIAILATGDYDINGTWDKSRYTDWQKVLIGNTANYTDLQGSISGGNTLTQFLVGGGYHRETTVFPGNNGDNKASLHFSISNRSQNQKFLLQVSGSYLYDNNNLQFKDLTNVALSLAPDAPNLYNADGSLNWQPIVSGPSTVSTWTNPLSNQYLKYINNTNNLISNGKISYHIFKGLDISSTFGYNRLENSEFQGATLLNVAPENRATSTRSAQFANGLITSWIIEPQLNYKKQIEKGTLGVLIGTTLQGLSTARQQYNASGFNSDLVLEDIRSASSVTVASTLSSHYKYNALFGRINYNWSDKYVINLTARRDGSSRFGINNQFHNFWSAGGAWIFSQEEIVKKAIPFMSFGKLHGSYGTTGNDQVGDYAFMNLYSPTTASVAYGGSTGLLPTGLPNPNLAWEDTKKFQVGIDLGFLKDRIILNTTYFKNTSSNELLSYALPRITGFTNIPAVNFPATVQNTGWELSLNSVNIKTKYFNWNTSINITIPKNKLLEFENISTSSYSSSLFVGQPITVLPVYHYLGVDPSTGLYIVSDNNGNPTTSPNSIKDKTVLINTAPKYYGGFQNSFRYKGLQLDLLFQFVKQIGPNYFFGSFPGQNYVNQPASVLNRWQKPGDISNIQRYTTGNVTAPLLAALNVTGNASDAFFSDASYLRLKNMSLSWQLPETWKKAARLENCRLFIQGQNLLTITNYLGIDPENKSTLSLPPLKILTIGLQITL